MKKYRSPLVLGLVVSLPLVLGGCASAVIGAGATVGVAAMEERPLSVHARDTTLATKIQYNLLNAGDRLVTSVGVEVYEGKALVTGVVESEAKRAKALDLVWKVEGVKDVYNELQVTDAALLDVAKDSWVTTQLISKITFDKDIYAVNYAVETVNGTVYLIGIAQSQAELDRVVAHARELGYVKRVISHVRVKEQG